VALVLLGWASCEGKLLLGRRCSNGQTYLAALGRPGGSVRPLEQMTWLNIVVSNKTGPLLLELY